MKRIACLAALFALAAPATALADAEPNDNIIQFEGPLSGGVEHAGTYGTADDVDWYAFYVSGQQQLKITLTNTGTVNCSSDLYLRDTDGGQIGSVAAYRSEAEIVTHTTPAGVNRFLIETDGCNTGAYKFKIEPGAGIVSGPARPAPRPTSEPNETIGQTFGPLEGGVEYAGKIETSNDEDWFRFHTIAGAQQMDVSLTNAGGANCDVDAALSTDSVEDGPSEYASAYSNRIDHMLFTSPGAATYTVKVTGCVGSGYLLRVDPASAVTLSPPPPPEPPVVQPPPPPPVSQACVSARNEASRLSRLVKSTTKKLRRARSARAKRRIRRQLRSRKAALSRARSTVASYC